MFITSLLPKWPKTGIPGTGARCVDRKALSAIWRSEVHRMA